MDRRLFSRFSLGLFGATLAGSAEAAETKTHRAIFQIDVEERRSQQLALGNVRNYAKHYQDTKEPFAVEIVAFGPGFSMVRGDISMMKGEINSLQKELGGALTISACKNTRAALAESMGKKPGEIPLLPGIKETPSGIVRIAELQEQGWSYIRP